jgi:hypothetical protein
VFASFRGITPPDEDTPKSKLPPGFRRAQEVFNRHHAMREPPGTPLHFVEGFVACVWMRQHGIRRAVVPTQFETISIKEQSASNPAVSNP